MVNQIGERLVFQNARNAMQRANVNAEKAVLTPSYLRLEAPLTTSLTTYSFDVLVNEQTNPNYITSQKLNLQDSILISSIGLFLCNPATSGTNTSSFPLYSYPNQVAFDGTSDDEAYSIYNGNLQLVVNQRTILTGWDCQRHYCVNQTQQLQAKATSTPWLNIDQLSGANDGFFPCEPNVVLIGSKKNQLTLNLPKALASVPASGNARVVLILRGILAQNSTSVN